MRNVLTNRCHHDLFVGVVSELNITESRRQSSGALYSLLYRGTEGAGGSPKLVQPLGLLYPATERRSIPFYTAAVNNLSTASSACLSLFKSTRERLQLPVSTEAYYHRKDMSSTLQEMEHETFELSSGAVAHIWRPQETHAIFILQHGYAEYAERYITSHNNIINHLVRAGYTVYAMDLWGHGRSPGTRGIVHLGKAVQDHVVLRKTVADQNPDVPVILFGHSLGGLVTAGSATANPSSIKGVVLTGPALVEPLPYIARLALGLAATAMPKVSVPQRGAPVEGMTRSTTEIEKYWADPLFHKDQISFLLAATALDAMEKVKAGLGDWIVPTLVLHGNADPYCECQGSENFVKSIRSEDKTFGVYEEGRHELLHDLEGDAVLERILRWVGNRVR
jgi:acylglycerol lipase